MGWVAFRVFVLPLSQGNGLCYRKAHLGKATKKTIDTRMVLEKKHVMLTDEI